MTPIIAPSLLAADFANLQRDIELINRSDADWLHLDIMDGQFVPNISFGIPVCKAIARHAQKPLDIHLMINTPEAYLEAFQQCGAYNITVHLEACNHLHRVVHQIKELGCNAGVALNPHTPVSLLKDLINDIDLVCIMSVNPGFGGQKFINKTYDKVQELRDIIANSESNALIEIDGGVNLKNAPAILNAGGDVLVAGSFVFNAQDPAQIVSDLKNVPV
ncbi:MAG: ribulose-phosphate 3-epimerase [Cyclobacteriaceae bacterium]|nr:MAG: ribulose-phosphate 3-epimerase [Cyclobacteriaceae bacterium]